MPFLRFHEQKQGLKLLIPALNDVYEDVAAQSVGFGRTADSRTLPGDASNIRYEKKKKKKRGNIK